MIFDVVIVSRVDSRTVSGQDLLTSTQTEDFNSTAIK